MDDDDHQHAAAMDNLRQYRGVGPPTSTALTVTLPAQLSIQQLGGSTETLSSTIPDSCRKRTRTLSEEVDTEDAMNIVEGAEDCKGELPEQDEAGLSPETPQLPPSALPLHFSVQNALRKYNILAEGAREGGPDYIPCL